MAPSRGKGQEDTLGPMARATGQLPNSHSEVLVFPGFPLKYQGLINPVYLAALCTCSNLLWVNTKSFLFVEIFSLSIGVFSWEYLFQEANEGILF